MPDPEVRDLSARTDIDYSNRCVAGSPMSCPCAKVEHQISQSWKEQGWSKKKMAQDHVHVGTVRNLNRDDIGMPEQLPSTPS